MNHQTKSGLGPAITARAEALVHHLTRTGGNP